MNIWSVILFYGSFQGIVIGSLLIRKGRKAQTPNSILAIILFVLSIRMLEYAVADSGGYLTYPELIYISVPLLTLLGPLLYWYVTWDPSSKTLFSFFNIIHFSPLAIVLTMMIPFYSSTGQYKLLYNHSWDIGGMSYTHSLYLILITLQLIIYSLLCFKRVRKKWSYIIKPILIVLTLYIITLIVTNFSLLIDKQSFLFLEKVSFFVLSAALHGLVIYALVKSKELHWHGHTNNEKYQTSRLTEKKMTELLRGVRNLMKERKIYLNPNLRVEDVSKLLETPSPYISQVLNRLEELNFSDYVNKYRVDYAKSLLTTPEYQKYTIAGIAEFTGFNNKNTFNRVFKKFTGMTPSDYTKRNR